jgi:hypothetical protein
MGRNRPDAIAFNGQRLAEAVTYYVQGVVRRAAPGLKVSIIRERMSAPKIKIGRGKHYQKNPLSAGCRQIEGNLVNSVRITVTTPGTNARAFRGTVTLSAKCGGGKAFYAGIQEANGRLQFRSFTAGIYAGIVAELRSGIAQIAAQFGARVA